MQQRQTEMHTAAASGDMERVETLLQHGGDIGARDRYGLTPLMVAVTNNRVDCASCLIDQGADLHATSDDGKTALHHAAMCGKLEAVRLLAGLGADVNAHDLFGDYTPLHLAAAHAKRDIVVELCGVLLQAGADVNARSKWGTTPLWSAAIAGRDQLLDELIDQGAELDARDAKGRTPLIFVVNTASFPRMAEHLLERGADVNAQDGNGRTALMYAALNAQQKLMENLLASGADIDIQDSDGRTALMFAAGEAPKTSEIGMLGREPGTTPEGGNAPNWSPDKKVARLARAYHKRAAAVQYLLERGADPEQRDNVGRTALDLALANRRVVADDNIDVVKVLRDYSFFNS